MDNLIPKIQVLDDMYGDKGPISWAARDYWYTYYASAEEQKQMDKEDKIQNIVSICFLSFIILIILSIILK